LAKTGAKTAMTLMQAVGSESSAILSSLENGVPSLPSDFRSNQHHG